MPSMKHAMLSSEVKLKVSNQNTRFKLRKKNWIKLVYVLERTQILNETTPAVDLSLQASMDYVMGLPLPDDPNNPAVSDFMIVPPATKPKKTLANFYAYKHITDANRADHERYNKHPTEHELFSKLPNESGNLKL